MVPPYNEPSNRWRPPRSAPPAYPNYPVHRSSYSYFSPQYPPRAVTPNIYTASPLESFEYSLDTFYRPYESHSKPYHDQSSSHPYNSIHRSYDRSRSNRDVSPFHFSHIRDRDRPISQNRRHYPPYRKFGRNFDRYTRTPHDDFDPIHRDSPHYDNHERHQHERINTGRVNRHPTSPDTFTQDVPSFHQDGHLRSPYYDDNPTSAHQNDQISYSLTEQHTFSTPSLVNTSNHQNSNQNIYCEDLHQVPNKEVHHLHDVQYARSPYNYFTTTSSPPLLSNSPTFLLASSRSPSPHSADYKSPSFTIEMIDSTKIETTDSDSWGFPSYFSKNDTQDVYAHHSITIPSTDSRSIEISLDEPLPNNESYIELANMDQSRQPRIDNAFQEAGLYYPHKKKYEKKPKPSPATKVKLKSARVKSPLPMAEECFTCEIKEEEEVPRVLLLPRFQPYEHLDVFYQENKVRITALYNDLGNPSLPIPSIIDETPIFPLRTQPKFTAGIHDNAIRQILQHKRKSHYLKRKKAIFCYKESLKKWKEFVKPEDRLFPPVLTNRPTILSSFSSDTVRSEEEMDRVLLSLLQSERNDPSQRWMVTLARISPMSDMTDPDHTLDDTDEGDILHLKQSGIPPVHLLASSYPALWWNDLNFYDPKPLVTFETCTGSKDLSHFNFLSGALLRHKKHCGGDLLGAEGLFPFTVKEKQLFKEKYSSFPKRFDQILKSFPGRNISQLVKFYYENKKITTPPFKKWWASSKSISHVIMPQSIPLISRRKPQPLPSTTVMPLAKTLKSRFEWLAGRPLIELPDGSCRIAHWSPMERIALVDGIIAKGLKWGYLASILASYREKIAHLYSVKSNREYAGLMTPTASLLLDMNRVIEDPPLSDIIPQKIPINSEDEVRLFFSLYSETLALDRFVLDQGQLPDVEVVSDHSIIGNNLPSPVRKTSLPINLHQSAPLVESSTRPPIWKIAAPIPSRKSSLSLTSQFGLSSSFYYSTPRTQLHSPPLSSRLAEGSPQLPELYAEKNGNVPVPGINTGSSVTES